MKILSILEKQNKSAILLFGFLLIVVVGIIDFVTGNEIGVSIFYVIPIAFITWLISRQLGLLASIVSAFTWIGVDIISGHSYQHPLVPYWNTLIRLAFFVIITLLISELKRVTDREKELARTDYLTGAVNSRHFYDLLQAEVERFHRYTHPFTFVYIDLDNFKTVNDKFGHNTGDQLLCKVVNAIKNHVRKIDVVARLGGDEFVLLMPETDQDAARATITKLQNCLQEDMQNSNFPITFSIGVVTCKAVPDTAVELVRIGDELMYSVKRNSKNAIKFYTYSG